VSQKPRSPHYEALIARNVEEALRLRLHRMTSETICRRMLAAKHPALPEAVIAQKAEGVASALSALGYWDGGRAALNAKILTQYYFALQLSIAEEVANADPEATLETIQKHTEQGHGLGTVRPPGGAFPGQYYIAALKSGHFGAYCASIDYNLDGIAFDAKPRNWSKVRDGDLPKLVALGDLLRRIPELRTLIHECLGVSALSFHVVGSSKNIEREAAKFNANFLSKSRAALPEQNEEDEIATYLTFATGFGGGEGVTPEYLSDLGFPITDFHFEFDAISGRDEIIGTYIHKAEQDWMEGIGLHQSEVGSSLIAPMWGQRSDIFLIHFMALYAMSIVVRYLPSLWYRIEHGGLDNLRSLLEYYVTVVDVVVPKLAIERIIGKELLLVSPGAFNAPI
jgi:hypothetical protein